MNATIACMEWRCVDTILADTLEIGDYIVDPDGQVAEIIDIVDSDGDALLLSTSDDYGDLCEWSISYDAMIEIYWLFDD